MPATKKARNLQPIDTKKIYPITVFGEFSGLGRHALRQMRLKGLKTITCGGRVFVRGADFYAHLESVGGDEQ